MQKTYITNSADETEALGSSIADMLKPLRHGFVAMFGEMGVGKTAFARGFSASLGITGIKSPTYTIVNEHRAEDGTTLYHFDMYRIEEADDLYSIGFYDYLQKAAFILTEWSENIIEEIPKDAISVNIARMTESENMRKITVFAEDTNAYTLP